MYSYLRNYTKSIDTHALNKISTSLCDNNLAPAVFNSRYYAVNLCNITLLCHIGSTLVLKI